MIPHLAATLIWAGFSLSPGATEVVFTTRAGRLRTWVGGDLAPLWAHSIEWLVRWSTLFPMQWPGPICPLVSEAIGRIFASMLLFFILYDTNGFFFKKAFNLEIRLKKKM